MKLSKRTASTAGHQSNRVLPDPYRADVVTFPGFEGTDTIKLTSELLELNLPTLNNNGEDCYYILIYVAANTYQQVTPLNPLYPMLVYMKIMDTGFRQNPRCVHPQALALLTAELQKWVNYFNVYRSISEINMDGIIETMNQCRTCLEMACTISNDESAVPALYLLYKLESNVFERYRLSFSFGFKILSRQRILRLLALIIDHLLVIKQFGDVKKFMFALTDMYIAYQNSVPASGDDPENSSIVMQVNKKLHNPFNEVILKYQQLCKIYFRVQLGLLTADSQYVIKQWGIFIQALKCDQSDPGSITMQEVVTHTMINKGIELGMTVELLPLVSIAYDYYSVVLKSTRPENYSSFHQNEREKLQHYKQCALKIHSKDFPELPSLICEFNKNELVDINGNDIYSIVNILIKDESVRINLRNYASRKIPDCKFTEVKEWLFISGIHVSANLQDILLHLQNLLMQKAEAQVPKSSSNKSQQAKAAVDAQQVPAYVSSISYGQATQRLSKNAQKRLRRRIEKQEVEGQQVKAQAATVVSTAPSTAALAIQWQDKWHYPHNENSPHEQVYPLYHPAVPQGFFGYVPAEVRAEMPTELANKCDEVLQSGHFVRHGQGIKYVTGQERTRRGLSKGDEYKLKLKGTMGNIRIYGHIQHTTQVEQQDRCLIAFDRVAEKAHSNRPVASSASSRVTMS